jgi:hypothetical protein
MANIFTLENLNDFSEKLNIDELYEKKRQYDLNKLGLYNKMLNRIHVRIRATSRQKIDEQFCWFIVPEVMLGVPKYDQAACIAYLMDRLKDNGFNVRYIHPNTLFISWGHWVPSYVRTELKKKTGIVVNELGERIDNGNDNNNNNNSNPRQRNEQDDVDPNSFVLNMKEKLQQPTGKAQQKKNYTPINNYKPSGQLIYDDDMLNKIEDKFL